MSPVDKVPKSHHEVITVPADQSIGECIRVMRDQGIGSVLVVSDLFSSRLMPVGIFTERDVLAHIDQIQHGGFWNKPIRTVMTAPLITLPLSRFDEAGKIMLKNHIRHLPLVSDGENPHVLAILSMRDLFEQYVKHPVPQAAHSLGTHKLETLGPRKISFWGEDPVWLHYVQQLFKRHPEVKVVRESVGSTDDFKIPVVVDWDTLNEAQQSEVLKRGVLPAKGSEIFVLHSPRTLETNSVSGVKIHFFQKPIATFSFYSALSKNLDLSSFVKAV